MVKMAAIDVGVMVLLLVLRKMEIMVMVDELLIMVVMGVIEKKGFYDFDDG